MKQIKKPSNWLISILLLPAIFAFYIVIVHNTASTWVIIAALASFISYLATLTYFCLRQKCYGQLIVNYIVVAIWIIIYIIQFHLI